MYEERGELDKQDFCRGKHNLIKCTCAVRVDILRLAQQDPN